MFEFGFWTGALLGTTGLGVVAYIFPKSFNRVLGFLGSAAQALVDDDNEK